MAVRLTIEKDMPWEGHARGFRPRCIRCCRCTAERPFPRAGGDVPVCSRDPKAPEETPQLGRIARQGGAGRPTCSAFASASVETRCGGLSAAHLHRDRADLSGRRHRRDRQTRSIRCWMLEHIAGILRETDAKVLVHAQGLSQDRLGARRANEAVQLAAPNVETVLEVRPCLRYMTGLKRADHPLIYPPQEPGSHPAQGWVSTPSLAKQPRALEFLPTATATGSPPNFHTGGATGLPPRAQPSTAIPASSTMPWPGLTLLFSERGMLQISCRCRSFTVFATIVCSAPASARAPQDSAVSDGTQWLSRGGRGVFRQFFLGNWSNAIARPS